METIETDYLVVGAGATGMAFTDALIHACDATVVLVDRRHQPGGHWLDAYPFVRLHQPSAFYGVNSMQLGQDRIETTGPEAGFYERATGTEIRAYYERVLTDRFVPSGQVRLLSMSDYLGDSSGDHGIRSRVTGREKTVRVRKALVDATYLQSEVPLTHKPSFVVDEGVRLIPPNDLVRVDTPSRVTVIGSGKTGMDACTWLLENGFPADRIRWIKPRELWGLNRAGAQPLDLVTSVIEGVADDMECAALAETTEDLFARLEACERLLRVDPNVEATMFRGATFSKMEVDVLRQIEHVVRLGRVRRLGTTEVALDGGTIPVEPGEVFVDCTAVGVPNVVARPIFEPGRITVQTMRVGLTTFNAALVGYIEATRDHVDEKNRVSPPNVHPNTARDWLVTTEASTRADMLWLEEPDIAEWLETARLNIAGGLRKQLNDPRMGAAIGRMFEHREAALVNLERLLADESAAVAG